MAESRDTNDPRDLMRGMRREALAEEQEEQQHDSGGQEHATAAERQGQGASTAERETAREIARTTRQQSDADALAVPRGDAATGGGGSATRGEPQAPGEEP